MKKILLSSLIGAMLISASAFASEGLSTKLGYSHTELESVNGNGGVFGMDYVIPLKVLGNGRTSGLETGFGFNLGAGVIDSNGYYNGDADIFIGYQYQGVNVRGTVGYGFLKVESTSSMHGPLYGGSVGYDFSEKWGVEAVYKTGKYSPAAGPDLDITYTGLNIVWRI